MKERPLMKECPLMKERPLMKECSLKKEHPPPSFGPIS